MLSVIFEHFNKFLFDLNNNIPPSPVVRVFAKSNEKAPISPHVPRNLFLNLLQKSTSYKARFVKPKTRIINKVLIKSAEQNVTSWGWQT